MKNCENQDLCIPTCVESTCAGKDCTQYNCTVCSDYPSCKLIDPTCTIKKCTKKKGCKIEECPPPPAPTCEETNKCVESCDVTNCKGNDCTQANCTKCTDYPSCKPSYVCSVSNCTRESGCIVSECLRDLPGCSDCKTVCTKTKCTGNNCTQSICNTTCGTNATCSTSNCTVKNCTGNTCQEQDCADVVTVEPECPAQPPIPSSCPKQGRSYCGSSQCSGGFSCTKNECITFYGQDANCASSNCSITNCSTSNTRSC